METGKDGLHPGDLELKKKHLRASLKLAKVAGKTDRGNSKWTVYADDDVILEATGAEAFEDELDANWTNFASKRYGLELIRAIRSEGLAKVAELVKGPMVKTAEPPMPEVPAVPEAPAVPEVPEALEDKADNPVEAAISALTEHLQETEKALGDLKDAMQEKSGETEVDLPSPAEVEADDASEVLAALDESADELSLLAEALETRVKGGKTAGDSTVDELIRLSKTAAEDNVSFREQAAEIIAEAKKKKGKEEEEEKEDKEDKKDKKDKKEDKKDKKDKEDKKEGEDEKEDKKGKKSKAEVLLENLLKARASNRRDIARLAMGEEMEMGVEEQLRQLREDVDALLAAEREEMTEEGEPEHPDLASDGDLEVEEVDDEEMDALDAQLAQLLDEPKGDEEEAHAADDKEEGKMDEPKTAEERRAWRAKVAAEVAEEGKKMDLGPAVAKDTDMPLAESTDLGQLDIKTDEARVEGIEEQYNKIMQQVQNLPKVREAVNHMVKLMRVGALSTGDLNNAEKLEVLAVDPEAAKYWKEYFGQGDKQSSAFGAELTKEMTHKKAQADLGAQRARLRRAYDIAVEMQDKGMIDDGVDSLHKQADALASLDDKSFEAFKTALARAKKAPQVKTASPAIQVGVNNDDQPAPAAAGNLVDQLKRMW